MSKTTNTEQLTNIRLQRATKANKKAIKRFYKNQHYSAAFKGVDHTFITIKPNSNDIAASVIISQLVEQNTNALLHALVTAKEYRNQGIAKALIEFAWQHLVIDSKASTVNAFTCFADSKLANFYQSCGFKQTAEDQLNSELSARYLAYKKHQANLCIYRKTS